MKLTSFISQIFAGGANKAVISAAGALLNAAETGHWTSVQSTVGYVVTVLVWLLPNVQKAIDESAIPPKG